MQAHDLLLHAEPRTLTRSEYERVVEQGLFSNERVELIHGIVVSMAPIGAPRADPVDFLARHFIRGLGDRAVVRIQQRSFSETDTIAPAAFADIKLRVGELFVD